MSLARRAMCVLLLLLVAAPLSAEGLDPTSYGGWPALGFAVALYVMAGKDQIWWVTGTLVVVVTTALTISYHVPVWQASLGSVAVIAPALLAQHLLITDGTGHLRLDEVHSGHYHLVTALTAATCGVFSAAASATLLDVPETLVAALMSFLAALTAQLTVLPLLIRGSGRPATAGAVELALQRILLTVVVLVVFWPTTRLGIAFMVFPMLGWAAVRATRREAHVQLFLVCLTAYMMTLSGHGPLSSPLNGVPDRLSPAVLYLFMAATAFMVVPLSTTVERLYAMTRQATRAATTVERLLDSASGALIIATDALGRITHYNVGAQQTLEFPVEEVLGRSPAMFHTVNEIERQAAHFGVAPDHVTVVLEMARRGERCDWEFIRKDGTPRMASLTLSEVTDADGRVLGYIGAGEDITDRLRAEEALTVALEREHASVLRLKEVDHVKQELVSNVSHELRTPITSISGYVELLGDGDLGVLTEAQVDAVRRIRRNTDRLELLVQDLLTLSRAESGTLEIDHDVVDVRDVASETFEMLREVLRSRDLDARLLVPEEPVLVLGDARALERALTNLMANAVKFTPDQGSVTLRVSSRRQDVVVTVTDTGLGIPAEDQAHLFTRFFRASVATEHAIQGTGLGLSIVHAIVTQHDGEVSIESSPGTGTTVTMLLPRLAGSTGEATPAEPGDSMVSVPGQPGSS